MEVIKDLREGSPKINREKEHVPSVYMYHVPILKHPGKYSVIFVDWLTYWREAYAVLDKKRKDKSWVVLDYPVVESAYLLQYFCAL